MNKPINEMPKGHMPIIGTIQCAFLAADHPYQKKLTGKKQEKKIMVGKRISGSDLPPFFAVNFIKILSFVKAMSARPTKKPMPMPR